jgi:predicted nucleic acid-binding protein
MAVFVDSCVLLDIFTEDRTWFEWSAAALAKAADEGPLVINAVVYAEISVRFDQIEELESALESSGFDVRSIPREAAFLAGKAFLQYRRAGGRKVVPLPDFLIGAHAAIERLPLLTRDVRRFRTHFPSLHLISPRGR